MAEIVLTINGIGQGHLMRGLQLCRWLRSSGRRPLVLHQGSYPEAYARRYPGISLPTVYRQAPESKRTIQLQIVAAARLSTPSLVIEDTHPVELEFPEDIARLLIVRPTVMEHMRMLHREYTATYARFLICDHPESPTWPYTQEETREIVSWSRFECLGPIFRRASSAGTAAMRSRYRLIPDQPMLVFSLGGGGEKPGSGDRERFLTWATRVAEEYQAFKPSTRFLFVCGPLFPPELRIPALFERIGQEPEFPALLACSTGAVIRPGYNALWECIATQTPFLPMLGTTYMEPTDLRLQSLAHSGLYLPASPAELASDETRERFAMACSSVLRRFSGAPRERLLEVVQEVAPLNYSRLPYIWQAPASREDRVSQPIDTLLLQVEGGIDDPQQLALLVEQMHGRPFLFSLALIPYLSRLSFEMLEKIDPQNLLSVSMLGFSGLPREAGTEFTEAGRDGTIQRRQLRLGFRLMRWRFRQRFRGTLAATDHTVPDWVTEEWKGLGGHSMTQTVRPALPECSGSLPVINLAPNDDPKSWGHVSKTRCFPSSTRPMGFSVNLPGLNIAVNRLAFPELLDRLTAVLHADS